MKRLVLVYGLTAGAIVSAFMAVSMIAFCSTGKGHSSNVSMIIGYLGMLISFAFIFVAIKKYRDQQNNGVVTFGKAFSMGLLISLVASTLYVITWAIIYKNFLPNFMENYSAEMIQQAKASLSGAQLNEKITEINKGKEMYASPVGFTLFTYAEILPVGILVSLIAALVLKRKRYTPAV